MTPDCFNDVTGAPEPFTGPAQTAERYRKHWEGLSDFTVRVRRILCADETCVVTENEWRGTHLRTFMGWPATGKPVRMRAIVVWHFKGDDLWGETIFFDNASLLQQIGASIEVPAAAGEMKPATSSWTIPLWSVMDKNLFSGTLADFARDRRRGDRVTLRCCNA